VNCGAPCIRENGEGKGTIPRSGVQLQSAVAKILCADFACLFEVILIVSNSQQETKRCFVPPGICASVELRCKLAAVVREMSAKTFGKTEVSIDT